MRRSTILLLTAGLGAFAPGGASGAEAVRVCTVHGAGFFVVPGSETCLLVAGRVRAQYLASSARARTADGNGFRMFMRFGLDARTPTEFGTVRTVARLFAERRTGTGVTFIGQRAGNTIVGVGNPEAAKLNTQINVEAAFIQFAGLTAGRAPSVFNDLLQIEQFHGLPASALGAGGSNQLSWRAQLGGGLSATISVEDTLERRNGPSAVSLSPLTGRAFASAVAVQTLTFGSGAGQPAGRNSRLADLIGNVRLDRGWGSLSLSGAVTGNTFISPLVADRPGFALAAAAKINLPALSPGSNLQLSGSFGRGAASFTMGNFFIGGANANGSFLLSNRVPFTLSDVVQTYDGARYRAELTRSWSAVGALQVYWTPRLRSTFAAAWFAFDHDRAFALADTSALRPFGVGALMANLVWTPVKGLDIAVEGFHAAGRISGPPVPDQNRPGRLTRTDDVWQGRVTLIRDF